MNRRTQELTTGAIFTAIFALLLLINRQTGSLFEEFILFLLPIPMVGFSSKYGFKSGLPVLAAMSLISIIVSTPMGIFYAVTEAFIGLVLGSGVYSKKDMTGTLLAVMGLSAVANVMNTIVLAALFGYNLDADIAEMGTLLPEMFEKAGADAQMLQMLETILTPSYLMQMMVISMVLLGLVQGFVIYQLSLLILRRLKFYVPKPKSLFEFHPPAWSGILAVFFFLTYGIIYNAVTNEVLKTAIQMTGLCSYMYLVIWGAIAIVVLIRTRLSVKIPLLGAIIAILMMMIFPFAEMVLGFLYILNGDKSDGLFAK